MIPQIEYRYIGNEASPSEIRCGQQTIFKGARFWLPENYDFTKEYGSDIRHALRIERVSPPLGQLRPLSQELAMAKEVWHQEKMKQGLPDALDHWQGEITKRKRRFRLPESVE